MAWVLLPSGASNNPGFFCVLGGKRGIQACTVVSFLFNKYLLSTYYGQVSINSLNGFPKIFLDFPENSLAQITLAYLDYLLSN